MTERIRLIHQMSDDTYGRHRVRAELVDMGEVVNLKRIERLMRLAGLRGISRRRGWCVTTRRDKSQRVALDLVRRQFTATNINQLWVADMTYLPTWAGFIYLAVVIDVYSRKVVGWAFNEQMTSDLVIAALNMAITTRRPESVIHHSDQGSQLGIWQALRRDGCQAFDGHGGRCLRQRDGRKLLCKSVLQWSPCKDCT